MFCTLFRYWTEGVYLSDALRNTNLAKDESYVNTEKSSMNACMIGSFSSMENHLPIPERAMKELSVW